MVAGKGTKEEYNMENSLVEVGEGTRQPSRVKLLLIISLIIAVLLAVVFIVLYSVEKNSDDTSSDETTMCTSDICISSANAILQRLDKSVDPCDDIYQYSCGGFIKNNYIRDNQKQVTTSTAVEEKMAYQSKYVLEKAQLSNYSRNSAIYKAAAYFQSCLNETQVEATGLQQILNIIGKHGSCPMLNQSWSNESWSLETILGRLMGDTAIAVFLKPGISGMAIKMSVGSSGAFTASSALDSQLDSRSKNESLEQERAAYQTYMKTVFKLLGANTSSLQQNIDDILKLQKTFDETERSSRLVNSSRKYMTLEELNNLTAESKFNWTLYSMEILRDTTIKMKPEHRILVDSPDEIKAVVDLIKTYPKGILANLITWKIVNAFDKGFLPLAFRKAYAKYHDKGVKYDGIMTQPRWKTCLGSTNRYFSYVTRLLYVNTYMTGNYRQRAMDLFAEIRDEFIHGLAKQSWLDNKSREAVKLKLTSMKAVMGYPDFIKNPVAFDQRYIYYKIVAGNFFRSQLNIFKGKFLKSIAGLGKPTQSREIPEIALGVNAFHLYSSNVIALLLGILQLPYYQYNRLKALNYGAIGEVIGHEIGHALDVSGVMYDENGKKPGRWTNESLLEFKKRTDCLLKQYNETYVFGRRVDGRLTLSENIADNAGLKYAYKAYKKWRGKNEEQGKLPGLSLTDDQLFVIGYAQMNCAKYRDKEIDSLMTDSHALKPVRARVPLSNFPDYFKAFGCKPSTNICTVW